MKATVLMVSVSALSTDETEFGYYTQGIRDSSIGCLTFAPLPGDPILDLDGRLNTPMDSSHGPGHGQSVAIALKTFRVRAKYSPSRWIIPLDCFCDVACQDQI